MRPNYACLCSTLEEDSHTAQLGPWRIGVLVETFIFDNGFTIATFPRLDPARVERPVNREYPVIPPITVCSFAVGTELLNHRHTGWRKSRVTHYFHGSCQCCTALTENRETAVLFR